MREGDRVKVVKCPMVPTLVGRVGTLETIRRYGGKGGTFYYVTLDGDDRHAPSDPFGPGQLRRIG